MEHFFEEISLNTCYFFTIRLSLQNSQLGCIAMFPAPAKNTQIKSKRESWILHKEHRESRNPIKIAMSNTRSKFLNTILPTDDSLKV